MTSETVRLLLIEDNPGDARLIQELLTDADRAAFSIVTVDRIAEGLDCLRGGEIDLVLLDLSLPDSQGLDGLVGLRAVKPNLPVIVLTGRDDEGLAVQAVREGAQDYLMKGRIDGDLLARAIRYGLERQRLVSALQAVSLHDELTGLQNRRGFLALAERQFQLARRTRQGLAVVYLDLNGMKQINDRFGHAAGDQALKTMARLLQSVFRGSDIIARLGGDEFVVMAVDVDRDDAARLMERLHGAVDDHNGAADAAGQLAFSAGVSHYHPSASAFTTLDDLMVAADTAMYRDKRKHRAGRAAARGDGVDAGHPRPAVNG